MPEENPESRLSKSASLGTDKTNYIKEALKWQYNLIGLASATAFAVISASGLPIVLAAGLELIYLSVTPNLPRFKRLVRSWQYEEEKKKLDQKARMMMTEMPPEERERFATLAAVCRDIRKNYDKLSSTSQIFVSQMDEKFQWLQYGYLRLLYAAHQQQVYLNMANPAAIQREIQRLGATIDKETPRVQEINKRRVEILGKRIDKFGKIKENFQVVQAQCSAIEDVLQLIRDQSMTMRDPQEITYRLDTLVQDVEQTENTVREVESLFEMTNDGMEEVLSEANDPGSSQRNRIKN